MQGKKYNVVWNYSFESTSGHSILDKIKQMTVQHLAQHDLYVFFQGLPVFQFRNNNSMCL